MLGKTFQKLETIKASLLKKTMHILYEWAVTELECDAFLCLFQRGINQYIQLKPSYSFSGTRLD